MGERGGQTVAARIRRGDPRLSSRARRLYARVRGRSGAALHGERKQRLAPVGTAESDPLRQGRVPSLRRLRKYRGSQSAEDRHEGRGALHPRGAGGRRLAGPAAIVSDHGGAAVREGLRRDGGRPDHGCRRILRADRSGLAERGRAARPPPGARRDALVETVLPLRRGHLAQGARRASSPRRIGPTGPQRRMVPHVQRRHHLDARQVGIPVVRGLGPRVPHVSLSLVDFDFAKEQLLLMLRSMYSHPNGQIPAYEWNFSDVNPPVHAWATLFLYKAERGLGREDIKFLERSFQGLHAQLQLVGEPQGPGGAQRLRRRIPRPRQHRRLRPERAAADRRVARAGRRHGVDGVLLPEHDRDRADPRRPRSDLRGGGVHVPPPFHVDRLCDGPHRRAP